MKKTGRVAAALTSIVALVSLIPAIPADAVISGTLGQIQVISPPAQAGSGIASNTTMWAWNEQQNVTLASSIKVDITSVGTYTQESQLLTGVSIPAGTVVDSHYISSVAANGSSQLDGTLSFPSDILGVEVKAPSLSGSDTLGSPGTTYPGTNQSLPGMELKPVGNDSVTLTNQRTIVIHSERTANGVDEVRVITKHDGPPTANAGGPYVGTEGSPVQLHGTANDAEGDPLTVAWSFVITNAKAGTVCTPANADSLAATLTCNDDAVVTATLSVSDPYNPPTLSTAQITVSNVAPSLAALTAPTGQVPLANAVNVSSSFTDPGSHDTHTATVTWGDTQSGNANVTESGGNGTLAASHTYAIPGHYTIQVTVKDDDGGLSSQSATVAINGPPTANAGGPYSANEGSTSNLTGTASDPEHDPLTTTWNFTPNAEDAGTTCTPTGASTLTPSITCNDDAVLNAALSANDGVNPSTVANTTVTFNNVAPVLSAVSASPTLVPTGGTVSIGASFTDVGTNDTHVALVNWGDVSTSHATINESNGSGTLSDSHVYTHSGIYTITVTLTDDNGGNDVRTTQVTVNTPPTVDAGGPYVGLEGTQMALTATANDVDGDALTYSWAYTTSNTKAGTVCNVTGDTHSATLTLLCNDDATVNATVTVSDGVNSPVHSDTTLTVGNQNPVAGAVTQQPTAPTGSTVAIQVPFSDPGTNDTHTATIDWGDSSTSAGTVSETNGAGTVSGAHNYTTDNHYNVTVTITDDDGGFATATGSVLSDTTPPVITPNVAPAPNGAGWNNSPPTVSFTAVDPLSPITSRSGCDPTTRSADTTTAGVSFTCTATSPGGTSSASATVKLDQVAPNLSGAATTPPNANGWYNGPVAIHWTCSDALSGINGSCPSNAELSSEGSSVSTSASVSDVAGNTTNAASAPVKIDTTAPATTAGTLPEWSNHTVTLALNATDNLSGVDHTNYIVDNGATQTGTSVLLADEGIHTIQFWSVDNAGNIEPTNTVTVKIDKTAPSITVSQAPNANGAGWNTTDVTVTFTCADSLSGVATCTPVQHVTAEGAGQQVNGSVTDNAGNAASASTTVNVDKTPPTISGSAPSANANGWYNAPVTVTWACNDALSGVSSCPVPTPLSSDGAGQSVSRTASDIAGNTSNATVSGINIDQTAPTISASVAPAPNGAGWNSSAVTVHFTCSDATSGVAPGNCPADQTVPTDGTTTVSGSATDRAGNSAATAVVVKIDTTAPGITGAQSPAPNGAGWNNSDVTVSFACTDSGSHIATAGCTAPVTLHEGANQSVTGTAADVAGNSSTTTVSGINVDETPPTLSGAPTTAPNADGWYNGPVTIHWTCGDALSGVVGGVCPPDSVLTSEGSAVTATSTVFDVAGNSTTASSAPVKIDVTAPATVASSVPDWANTNVTLNLSATDALSGVAATHYVVDSGSTQTGDSVLISDEGTHTVQFWSVDHAGNTETAHTVTVKLDKTAPSITVAQAPDANGAGWNKSDVTVTFTCGDSLSGVASCTSPQTITTEGAGQNVAGLALDNAGNSASASTTVNIDKTPPTINGVYPPANGNGWYSTPVTVSWACADALSGVASCDSPTTLSNDGASQSVTGNAADTAGNTNSSTVSGINIDQTAPTLTASAPATPLGWYASGPVTVHWTCADNLSGVTSCPGDDVVTAEGFTTLAHTITDQAGNTTTTDITIRIDKTPPTIVGQATPAPNSNGWNNTDVNVSFTCGDSLSGVTSCSSPSTLHEGANQSVTGHATDAAGNPASATVAGINVDKTPPTLSSAPTTAPNANGWYNTPVTIHWTCGDALSGVDTSTCPPNTSINTEGTAQQVTRMVYDLAGNATSSTSSPVKIDLTPPVTHASAVSNSFSNTDVTVTLSASDNLSGVAQTYYTVDGGPATPGTSITFSTDGVHTLTYWSVDNAGNQETVNTATVKIDKTAPTITFTKAPPANGAGWNKVNVTVTFTCGDSLSGIASCTTPQNVTSEGAGQIVPGSAVDNAGNIASTSASVSLDKTPPTITGSLNATANSNGWFKVPVTASFACADALSGLATCSGPATFGQGANQTATGSATDVAGNSSTATVGPVNVDLTPPTITATPDRAPDAGGTYSGPVTIHFTCTDALSGIAAGACPADVVVSNDGVTTVTGSTTDRAGNTSTTSATITVNVQSVRAQKQNALIQISNVQAAATTSKHDANMLKVARDALSSSIDPSLWGTGNYLQQHHGVKVFEKEKQAVDKLTQMLADPATSIPAATLQAWIGVLTNADRVLATTQLNAAIAANGDAGSISQSQALIAAGDTAAASGNNSGAITNYKNAWQKAMVAIGKPPDGGDDPGDY
jgi:hypothetical protein